MPHRRDRQGSPLGPRESRRMWAEALSRSPAGDSDHGHSQSAYTAEDRPFSPF